MISGELCLDTNEMAPFTLFRSNPAIEITQGKILRVSNFSFRLQEIATLKVLRDNAVILRAFPVKIWFKSIIICFFFLKQRSRMLYTCCWIPKQISDQLLNKFSSIHGSQWKSKLLSVLRTLFLDFKMSFEFCFIMTDYLYSEKGPC